MKNLHDNAERHEASEESDRLIERAERERDYAHMTTPNPAPTPRCDAKRYLANYGAEVVPVDFARQLERELAAESADVRKCDAIIDDLNRQLAAARAKCEQLKGALEMGQRNCDDVYDDLKRQLHAHQVSLRAVREQLAATRARLERAEGLLRDLNTISPDQRISDFLADATGKGDGPNEQVHP